MAEPNSSGTYPPQGTFYQGIPWSSAPMSSSSLSSALVKTDYGRPEETLSMQSQLESALSRSITIVFWYKAMADPIRLMLEIPTFPFFQLTQFPNLIGDLSLSNATYIDVYNENTCHWEQRPIFAVSQLRRDQRLLLRARKSLLEGLSEDECVGLRDEVNMQSTQHSHTPTKAQVAQVLPSPNPAVAPSAPAPAAVVAHPNADETDRNRPEPETAPPGRFHNANPNPTEALTQANGGAFNFPQQAYPMGQALPPASGPAVTIEGVALPAQGPTAGPGQYDQTDANPTTTGRRYTFSTSYAPSSPGPMPVAPLNPAVQIPYHAHPPLKRWPNDYTVSEIADGFRQMDALIAQRPSVTQRIAFERVFGCRYVKSTVCRHRGVWRRADGVIRESFEKLGSDERAIWGEFVRRVEGRQSMKAQESGLLDHNGQPPLLDDGDDGDDTTMSSPNAPRMQPPVQANVAPPMHPSLQRPIVPATSPLFDGNVQVTA